MLRVAEPVKEQMEPKPWSTECCYRRVPESLRRQRAGLPGAGSSLGSPNGLFQARLPGWLEEGREEIEEISF